MDDIQRVNYKAKIFVFIKTIYFIITKNVIVLNNQ